MESWFWFFVCTGTRCDCLCPSGYTGRSCEITSRPKGQYTFSQWHHIYPPALTPLRRWRDKRCHALLQLWPWMAAGAVGARGRPAAGAEWCGVDSATTRRPAEKAWPAADWNRSLLTVSEGSQGKEWIKICLCACLNIPAVFVFIKHSSGSDLDTELRCNLKKNSLNKSEMEKIYLFLVVSQLLQEDVCPHMPHASL